VLGALPGPGESIFVDRVAGRLVLYSDASPIENTLGLTTLGMEHEDELGDVLVERFAAITDHSRKDRCFLEAAHLHSTGMLATLALHAAGGFDLMLGQYVDGARRHAWRWVSRDGSCAEPHELLARLTCAFGHLVERTHRDISEIERAVAAARTSSLEISEDVCHRLRDSNTAAGAAEICAMITLRGAGAPSSLCRTVLDSVRAVARDVERIGGPNKLRTRAAVKLYNHGRRALKRASGLIDSIGYREQGMQYVNGVPVRIPLRSGMTLELARAKSGGRGLILASALALTHGRIDASLLDVTGLRLFRLCLFAENTPELDLLLALLLHVEAGNEHEILRGSNWFEFGPLEHVREALTAAYPDLVDKLPGLEPAVPQSQSGVETDLTRQWSPPPINPCEWIRYEDVNVPGFEPERWTVTVDHEGDDEWVPDLDHLRRHVDVVDDAIRRWLGGVFRRWNAVRPAARDVYENYGLPEWAVGWSRERSRAFHPDI